MNDKKFIIIIAVITMIILVGGITVVSSANSSSQVSMSQRVKAETVEPTSFDWGNIPMKGGAIAKTFTIKNTGSDILKLTNIRTSCHCTKANVTISGNDSPYFGMSGISSWVGEVAPGKEAKLHVIFDPAFHGPQGIGPIQRYISVETNEASNPKITFTLSGTVIK